MLRWGLTQTTDVCGQVLHHHATLASDTGYGHVWAGSAPPCYARVWPRATDKSCINDVYYTSIMLMGTLWKFHGKFHRPNQDFSIQKNYSWKSCGNPTGN